MECWTKARVKGGGRPGAVGGKRAQQNAPKTHPWHDACEKTGLQKSWEEISNRKVSTWTLSWTQFGLQALSTSCVFVRACPGRP